MMINWRNAHTTLPCCFFNRSSTSSDTPTRCSPCPYPPGAPAQHSFSAAVQPPLHGRLFYLNPVPKSTYLILSAPSEGSEIRFFCKKETRLRKAGFPACAAPAFFCKNVTFMLYFYHKSLFLVKMICVDFPNNFTSPFFRKFRGRSLLAVDASAE